MKVVSTERLDRSRSLGWAGGGEDHDRGVVLQRIAQGNGVLRLGRWGPQQCSASERCLRVRRRVLLGGAGSSPTWLVPSAMLWFSIDVHDTHRLTYGLVMPRSE